MSYAPLDLANLSQTSKSRGDSLLSSDSFFSHSKTRNGHEHHHPSANDQDHPIIAHSHLCWDWVWQRPQQFLSRLSKRRRVLFIELHRPDPKMVAPSARLKPIGEYPNITLLQMQFPLWRWRDGTWIDGQRRALLREALNGPLRGQFIEPVQWFYDPMATPAFAGHFNEVCTVYDCMDELSKFNGAPQSIAEREADLLKVTDVVFTGGKKLFESKSRLHDNCHFYGCGVDVEHFGKACLDETLVPEDLRSLPGPVLGFFGVIDERMDYPLIAKLARAVPNGSVVMIGPVTKIDERSLPTLPNLHWLGARDYSALPSYCKGFDVCIMPFALNEATEFINPTKALEYMATGRNIVSSAVPDVVRNFGSVVKVARSHGQFTDLCRQLAECPDREAVERGLEMARSNSWNSIVKKLEEHISEAIKERSLTANG